MGGAVTDDKPARCASRIAHESGAVRQCQRDHGPATEPWHEAGDATWLDDDDRVIHDPDRGSVAADESSERAPSSRPDSMPMRGSTADYPLDRAGRRKLRAERRQEALARAERAAAVAGMSINCERRTSYGTHPTEGPGCANTGIGCLCACHDREDNHHG